jgi:MFS family permease
MAAETDDIEAVALSEIPGQLRVGWVFGATLVLISSAIVLVSEIVAVRAIAPYVGVTLETLSAVIGCVLAGISVGSWLGGWLADRVPARSLITTALALGGALLVASPYIVRALGPDVSAADPSGALLLTTAAFFLPSVALSAVTPTVLKAIGQGSRRLGSVAGAVSAIGTVGALIGNFSAGFILVGSMRSGQILVLCGGVAMVLAAVTVFALGSMPKRLASGRTVVALVLLVAGIAGAAVGRQLPCDAETKYVCLNIDETAPDTYLIRSNISSQSVTSAVDPTYLEFSYIRDIAALVAATKDPTTRGTAFGYVGGGGYTLPLYFEATYPDSSHVVYEIDDELVDRVTTVLRIDNREERFPTRIGDARTTVADSRAGTMDVVVGDAFSGLVVPWHLTTKEWLEDVVDLMKDDGLYIMNLIDYDHYDLARAELRTFREVFDEVAVVAPSFVFTDANGPGTNLVLMGGRDLPDPSELNDALNQSVSTSVLVTGDELDQFIGDETNLTDDFAPVDQLIGTP